MFTASANNWCQLVYFSRVLFVHDVNSQLVLAMEGSKMYIMVVKTYYIVPTVMISTYICLFRPCRILAHCGYFRISHNYIHSKSRENHKIHWQFIARRFCTISLSIRTLPECTFWYCKGIKLYMLSLIRMALIFQGVIFVSLSQISFKKNYLW